MATGERAAEALWRFSLMLYGRPGMQDALIGLQDGGGHNVNLILFGLWLGLNGERLGAADLARARAAIAKLDRGIVTPLRGLRRGLKGDPDPDVRDLRRRVLALELAAERRIQARLAGSFRQRRNAKTSNRAALAEANLCLVLGPDDFVSAEAAMIRKAIADA